MALNSLSPASAKVHLRGVNSCALRSGSLQYFLRNPFLRIFPVAVLGKLSRNSIDRGHLKCDIRERQNSSSSASVGFDPGFATTSPLGTSPHFSSGTGITAAS